jgi:ATP-dependent DNA helicase RecQ
LKVATYTPVRDQPQLTFIVPRQDADKLPLNVEQLRERAALITSKMEAIISYTVTSHQCRMQMIQDYFNETSTSACQICDVCIQKRKTDNASAFDSLRILILKTLDSSNAIPVETLEGIIAPRDTELFVDVVRELADEGFIEYDHAWRLRLTPKK